jgi:predicted ATPase/DNA-binding CsgD family transcriptional regulator
LTDDVHGFPRALTSFVGRADEVARVAGMLGDSRMVMVTGPGGVGKTRLASEVARQVAARFADGAWLVELAAVGDPALLPAVVAAAMGVQQAPGTSAAESLLAALARRQVLLVLDNCEHLRGAVAGLCRTLLLGADDVRVLATSREPTGIAGEARYRLRPLPVTDPAGGQEHGVPAAVALFTDRARQADPDFALDGETGPQIAELVARLDGMPLAIELAAARAEALGLGPLLDRLTHSFRLLTSGDPAADPRHRSLAAAVEWSYQLLSEAEQEVFRRLSAFPGPFSLDGVLTVAGTGAEPAVLRLVDCSLLAPPRAGPDGRLRYVMLETLRAFGRVQLTVNGELGEADAALTRYALDVVQQASAGLETSPGEVAAVRWLDAEDATTQHAMGWARQHEPATALRLAIALTPWWMLRGRTEGYAQLSAAVRDTQPEGGLWADAQIALGLLSQPTDDTAAMLRHFTAARDTLASHPPSQAYAYATLHLANTLLNAGRVPEGTAEAHQALDLARAIGYADAEAGALLNLGLAAYYSDDLGAAIMWARQACQIDPATITGDTARACRIVLTMALTEAGEIAAARESNTATLALAREAGDIQAEASAVSMLAELELLAGHLAGAWAQLDLASRLALLTGSELRLRQCLRTGRELCAVTGRWAEAATLEAARMTHERASDVTIRPREVRRGEELLREAASTAGEKIARTAEERGAAMTLETAAEFLLIVTEAELRAPTVTGTEPQPQATPGVTAGLSDRERELVTLVAQGRTDAQIAGQLFISVSTVRSHLDRIRDKTSCRRRADLTRLALQAGLA